MISVNFFNKSSIIQDSRFFSVTAYQSLQMRIKEKKKEEAKREQEQYDKKKEAEAADYNPWGKGGGGAPMKDTHGNLICGCYCSYFYAECHISLCFVAS